MSEQSLFPIAVQPVISYPREAEVGKTYLMTIDLQVVEGSEWQFEEEEYPIYCMVDSEPLFSCKAVGEPAISLHRFGGSYGAARFLLNTADYELDGKITITMINCWGVPIQSIELKNIKIKHGDSSLTTEPNFTNQELAIFWTNKNIANTLAESFSNEMTEISMNFVEQNHEIIQNLPYSGVVSFIGREQELNHLHEMLNRENSVCISAILGMGGVGKTELALQYAQKSYHENTYPGGICWIRSREEIGTQIISFVRSYLELMPPEDLELVEKVRWCWRQWHEGAVLLVFDDVQQYEEVEPFLPPQESRFKILMTSRSRFGSSVQELQLDVLSEEAALEVLRALVQDTRIDQELQEAQQLCSWLGYLPLGLELVARYLARRQDLSLSQLRQRLQDSSLEARALLQAETSMTASYGISAAFELSWRELTLQGQHVAMLLSLFAPAPIPWDLVRNCLPDWNEEELESLRNRQLVGLHLLQRVGKALYQLHPLMREFLGLKQEQQAVMDEMRKALCRVMITIAQQISQVSTRSVIEQVVREIPHLIEIATTLKSFLTNSELIICISAIARFYEIQVAYGEAIMWAEQGREVAESYLGGSHPILATSLNDLALLYEAQGRYAEAEPAFRRSLEIRQQALGANHSDVAQSLNNLAGLYQLQGRYAEAEPAFRRSLEIRQQALGANHPDVAQSLNNLAGIYELRKQYDAALSLYQQSLSIVTQSLEHDNPSIASSLNNLAGLYRSQGRYSEAEPLYARALDIWRTSLGESHPSVASSLNNLATLYYVQERYSEAETLYDRSRRILQEKLGDNHPDTLAILNNIVELYYKLGRNNEARALYKKIEQVKAGTARKNLDSWKASSTEESGNRLTPSVVLGLAFKKFLESSAEEVAKNFTESAIAKIDNLHKVIWDKMRGKSAAEAALTSVEAGSKAEFDRLVAYLQVAIDDDPHFAGEIRSLAQEIYAGKIQDTSSMTQNNYDNARGWQTKVEGGTAYIGGEIRLHDSSSDS